MSIEELLAKKKYFAIDRSQRSKTTLSNGLNLLAAISLDSPQK